jgi:hypothetical protein
MPTLYRLAPTRTANQLSVEQVWSQSGGGPLAPGYSQLVTLDVAGTPHLLAVEAGSGAVTAFALQDGEPWFTELRSDLSLEGDYEIVEPFVLGGVPYLLAYAAGSGNMEFYPVGVDLGLGTPYKYFRTRPPGVTQGFTVTKPIVVAGFVYILCYAAATGAVNAYSLSVIATAQAGSPAGSPPLLATNVWNHFWAHDWTNFAFFQLGGENFFFKINTGELNVNIDHMQDEPARGTVEVGTHLELENALRLNIVRSFELGGDPYFITYMTEGTATVNRFRGDCPGWVPQASLTMATGAGDIVPLRVGASNYALFY